MYDTGTAGLETEEVAIGLCCAPGCGMAVGFSTIIFSRLKDGASLFLEWYLIPKRSAKVSHGTRCGRPKFSGLRNRYGGYDLTAQNEGKLGEGPTVNESGL